MQRRGVNLIGIAKMITKEELQYIIEQVTSMYDWHYSELPIINDYIATINQVMLEKLNELIAKKTGA